MNKELECSLPDDHPDVIRAKEAKLNADARALWAVRVLDRWAKRGTREAPRRWQSNGEDNCTTFVWIGSKRYPGVGSWSIVRAYTDDTHPSVAPSADAARIAAAEALVAEDPSLGEGL